MPTLRVVTALLVPAADERRQTNGGRSDDADGVCLADFDQEIKIGATACALSEIPREGSTCSAREGFCQPAQDHGHCERQAVCTTAPEEQVTEISALGA